MHAAAVTAITAGITFCRRLVTAVLRAITHLKSLGYGVELAPPSVT